VIVPGARAWRVHVDALVRADAGGAPAALFLAARAALCDTAVPATRAVEYRPPERADEAGSGFDTRKAAAATDFELLDYWDAGAPLGGRDAWPVAVTLHLAPPVLFVDATPAEEAAAPLRVLLAFSFAGPGGPATLRALRVLGGAELAPALLRTALAVCSG
jgi:exosome complex component RRP42